MVQTRLLDLLNLIDEAIEDEDYRRALLLIEANWFNLPDPSPLRERTALVLATVGRKREAVEVYSLAARHYANSGFPTRSLAAIKQMQNLNPSSTQLLDHFTTLYSVRSPFLERGKDQADFPQPTSEILSEVSTKRELDVLFSEAVERAIDPQGTTERPEALPALPLLSLLPPKALRRLLDFLEYEIFAQPQPVIDVDEEESDLFWAVSSDLLVSNEEEKFRIPPGSLLGLSSYGQNSLSPTHRVVSQKGSELLRLSRRGVNALAEEFPDFPNRLATLRRHALTEGIIERHPIFAGLDKEARAELPTHLVGLKLEAGTICIRQGKVSPGLYILLDGSVDVIRKDDDWEITLETLRAGAMVGEVGLVDPRPAIATTVTTKACHMLFFGRKEFTAFSEKYSSLAAYAQKRAAERLRTLDETLSATDLVEVD